MKGNRRVPDTWKRALTSVVPSLSPKQRCKNNPRIDLSEETINISPKTPAKLNSQEVARTLVQVILRFTQPDAHQGKKRVPGPA
jgi:hypothetical protein